MYLKKNEESNVRDITAKQTKKLYFLKIYPGYTYFIYINIYLLQIVCIEKLNHDVFLNYT